MNIYITYFVLIVGLTHFGGTYGLPEVNPSSSVADIKLLEELLVGSNLNFPIDNSNDQSLQTSSSSSEPIRVPNALQQFYHAIPYARRLVNNYITQKSRIHKTHEIENKLRPTDSLQLSNINFDENNNDSNIQRTSKRDMNFEPMFTKLSTYSVNQRVPNVRIDRNLIQSKPLMRAQMIQTTDDNFGSKNGRISSNLPEKATETSTQSSIKKTIKMIGEFVNKIQNNSKPQFESVIKTQTQVISQNQNFRETEKIQESTETPKTMDRTEIRFKDESQKNDQSSGNHTTDEVKEDVSISLEMNDSDNQSNREQNISSVDTNSQILYLDKKSLMNDNFEPDMQINDQTTSDVNTNPEPTPESITVDDIGNDYSETTSPPVSEDSYYRESDKELIEDTNYSQMKLLLDQFNLLRQQFYILKAITPKGLKKSDVSEDLSSYLSAKDCDIVETSVTETTKPKTEFTSDGIQTRNSFESNHSILESKTNKEKPKEL